MASDDTDTKQQVKDTNQSYAEAARLERLENLTAKQQAAATESTEQLAAIRRKVPTSQYTDRNPQNSSYKSSNRNRKPYDRATQKPRNAAVEYYSTTPTQFEESQRSRLTDPTRSKKTERSAARQQQILEEEQQADARAEEQYYERTKRRLVRNTRKKILKKARVGLAPTEKSTVKLRAKAVNRLFWFIIPFVYLLQFWAAIILLAFLGLAGFFQSGSAAAQLGNAAFAVIRWARNTFAGADNTLGLSDISMGIAIIALIIVLAQAFVLTTAAYVAYKLAGVSPFEGRNTVWSWIIFVFLVVGYCLPVLNLVPWIVPWMIMVARNAR